MFEKGTQFEMRPCCEEMHCFIIKIPCHLCIGFDVYAEVADPHCSVSEFLHVLLTTNSLLQISSTLSEFLQFPLKVCNL